MSILLLICCAVLILFIPINELIFFLNNRKPQIVRTSVISRYRPPPTPIAPNHRYRTRQEFIDYAESIALERSGSNPAENLNSERVLNSGGLSVNESSVMNSVIISDSLNKEENKKEDALPLKKIDYIADRLKSIEESMGE